MICSAETLSDAKREKLARSWDANVFDVFGMSEAGLMGAEGNAHDFEASIKAPRFVDARR